MRSIGRCVGCDRTMPIAGRGLCGRCYTRARKERDAARVRNCECGDRAATGSNTCERCQWRDGRGETERRAIEIMRAHGGVATIYALALDAGCYRTALRYVRILQQSDRISARRCDAKHQYGEKGETVLYVLREPRRKSV